METLFASFFNKQAPAFTTVLQKFGEPTYDAVPGDDRKMAVKFTSWVIDIGTYGVRLRAPDGTEFMLGLETRTSRDGVVYTLGEFIE